MTDPLEVPPMGTHCGTDRHISIDFPRCLQILDGVFGRMLKSLFETFSWLNLVVPARNGFDFGKCVPESPED